MAGLDRAGCAARTHVFGAGALRRNRIALLAGVAFASGAAPALANNCPAGNDPPVFPSAPAAQSPQGATEDGQSYGSGKPLVIQSIGTVGTDGAQGADDDCGTNAQPGGAAGALTYTLTNATVTGASESGASVPYAVGLRFLSQGGTGGIGGFAGSPYLSVVTGGIGGPAGGAGAVTLNFSGTVDMSSVDELGVGIVAVSQGGSGSFGGGTGQQGVAGSAGGAGGSGGASANVSSTVSGNFLVSLGGVLALSQGGSGGQGGNDITAPLTRQIQGGDGGDAGAAGNVTLSYTGGTITSGGAGLVAVSAGGNGAAGGTIGTVGGGKTAGGVGGDGGDGGAGASSTVTLAAGATISVNRSGLASPAFNYTGAVTALSAGGVGGVGQPALNIGITATAGNGGNGGTGGAASATILGSVTYGGVSNGDADAAIQVLSGGGLGGSGGDASAINGEAGGGGLAGNGGTATLTFGSSTVAAATTSDSFFTHAALVQSVGGSGGSGGNGQINTTGGTGAAGGNGSTVTANIVNGNLLSNGADSHALLIQSIGGGGGSGGSASTTGSGFFAMAVGGDSGAGAPAGAVAVTNGGIITNYGSAASGIAGQSIGGGGGNGGAGISDITSFVPTAAVSIGGRGGGGGAAGTVNLQNLATGQITTYGSNSYGILAQSIGGGGGTGGIAAARAVSFTLYPEIPAISSAVGLGGSGGAGNTGNAAAIQNAGIVLTSGEQSYGLLAQSIGGAAARAVTRPRWPIRAATTTKAIRPFPRRSPSAHPAAPAASAERSRWPIPA